MKKIPFRQTTQFGCGSYTLANIFDDKGFIAEIPEHDGETVTDLNVKLAKFYPGICIEFIFLTNFTFKVNNRFDKANVALFLEIYDKKENPELKAGALPFLVTIARPNGALHYIGLIQDIATGKWHVVDSCEEEVIEVEILWFIKNYHIVSVGIFYVPAGHDKRTFAAFPPDQHRHLFV